MCELLNDFSVFKLINDHSFSKAKNLTLLEMASRQYYKLKAYGSIIRTNCIIGYETDCKLIKGS